MVLALAGYVHEVASVGHDLVTKPPPLPITSPDTEAEHRLSLSTEPALFFSFPACLIVYLTCLASLGTF